MSKKNWVDFTEIKKLVSMEMLLRHYGVELKKSGKNHAGCCPIHKGTNSKQFSVDLTGNKWKCFGDCQNGGNIYDFVIAMEGLDSAHAAALLIKNWFLVADEGSKQLALSKETVPLGLSELELVRKGNNKTYDGPVNPPLKFELKGLDSNHPFLKEMELLPQTINHFGLGYCSKGMMKGRIAIPIYDHEEILIAYGGRAVDQELAKEDGKYKLPPSEKGFFKSHVLYNLNGMRQEEEIFLVESYKSVWKLHQENWHSTVSPFGSSLSDEQADLLIEALEPGGKISIFFDDDESGRTGAEQALIKLCKRAYVKIIEVGKYAKKPHLLTSSQIMHLLG